MPNTLTPRVRLAGYEFSLKTGELSGGGQVVRLAEKPFRVLLILIEGGGELVTREEIQRKLWPGDTVVDFEHGINTAIRVLRRALGDSAEDPKYIETIPRRGYRLMVPVERLDSVASDASGTEVGSSSHDGPELQLEPAGLTGKTVSHYRVLEVVGGGGMGVVYRAEDLKLGRAVALKFLPEEVGNDPYALERFEREARAASSLDHPNICSIYEFGEHEGRPFIVMQLLQGQTLRDCLATVQNPVTGTYSGQPLPIDVLLEEAFQILDGLEAAHEKGIIHRDIKPANIFVTDRGVVKILDFGLAKLLWGSKSSMDGEPAPEQQGAMADGAVDLSCIGVALGTAAYMSPEQVRGEKLDTRTDLFSFGLVLYEMATGRRAFSTENATALRQALLNSIPIPVHDLNPHLPLKLEEIVNKCLEKDRNLRYRNVAELREDLRRMKDDVPGLSSGARLDTAPSLRSIDHGGGASDSGRSVTEPSSRWSQSRIGVVLSLSLLTLIAAAYGAYTLWRTRETPPYQSMKIGKLTNSGKVSLGTISGDGKYVVYVADEWNGQKSLRLQHMATGSDTQITPPAPAQYTSLTFSPNGDFVYFCSMVPEKPGSTSLYRIPVLGGTPHQIAEDVDFGVSFSPDGVEFAFVRDNPDKATSRLIIARADGTRERVLSELVGREYTDVAWSPDGKWIAAITTDPVTKTQSRVILLSPVSGEQKTVFEGHGIFLQQLGWLPDGRHLVATFYDASAFRGQIGEISLSDGKLRRITNDLSNYFNLSVTKDGKRLATTQFVMDTGLYVMSAAPDESSDPSPVGDRTYEAHWLPDGRILTVDSDGRVLTMSADGSNQTAIFQDNLVTGRLSVCPGGHQALFGAMDKTTSSMNIWSLDLQNYVATVLTDGKQDSSPVCSPDNSYFLYLFYEGGKAVLMRKPLAGGPARKLSDKILAMPAISPDGHQIAALATEGSGVNAVGIIEIFPSEGETPLRTFLPAPFIGYGLQFSADGQAIYYVTRKKGASNVMMQSLAGGAPTPVTKFHDKFISSFEFDWTNKRLAVVRGTNRRDLVLITQQEEQ